jgi:WD40 repeat protein/energy-coupling factor transporter ATP-binding protein EcfA2
VARVFLSYASGDLARAEDVFSWLDADGHDVFFARDGIPAGQVWKSTVYDELSRVDAVLCLITRAYLASMWCTAELAIGDARGCRLIPLRGEPDVTHPLIDEQQHTSADPAVGREQALAAVRWLDSRGRPEWRGGNPYPGLRPFEATMSALYFGRSAEIRDLAAELRAVTPVRALAIVGQSGCGKSSLLQAGLLPHLDQEWIVVGPWSAEDGRPRYQLAEQLHDTARTLGLDWHPKQVREWLEEPDGLRIAAHKLLRRKTGASQVLIALDQAEALFSGAVDAGERSRFAELLRAAFEGPVRLVLTVRLEYQDELRAFLAPVRLGAFLLGPPERPALRPAIEEPARIAGLRLTPELSNRLLDDTDTGDALPLLAFTLHELAGGQGRGAVIDLDAYDRLGRLKGILARHADAALDAAAARSGLDADAVMDGLVRMVAEDETGRRTRRRIASAGLSEDLRTALAEFVERRLVVSDGGYLRFVHDTLLTAWPTLTSAVDRRARTLRAAVLVERAAADWIAAGEEPGYLWSHPRLAAVVADLAEPGSGAAHVDLEDPGLDLDEPARRFLGESLAQAERDASRERHRLVRTLTVVSALLVLVLVAGVIAAVQARIAQSGRNAALVRELVARVESVRMVDPQLALRLGLVAERLGETPATRASLLHTLTMNEYAATITNPPTSSVFAVALRPDGKILASGEAGDVFNPDKGEPPATRLWDVADLRHPKPIGAPLTGHSHWVTALAFSPDGLMLATASHTETILWDVSDPSSPRQRAIFGGGEPTGTDEVGVAFGPSGTLLATTHGGELRLYDLTNPDAPISLGPPLASLDRSKYVDVAFSSDGRYLAGSFEFEDTEGMVWRVTDPAAPVEVARFTTDQLSGGEPGPSGLVPALAFVPGKSVLALAVGGLFNSDSAMTMWEVSDSGVSQLGNRLTDHVESVRGVAFDPDGTLMATVGEDGLVFVYDVSRPEAPRVLGSPRAGHTNVVYAAAFGPSGELVTAGADNKIILWAPGNPVQPALRATLGLYQSEEVTALAFGSDGRTLAGGGEGGTARVWDVTDPAAPGSPGELSIDDGPVAVLAFRPGTAELAVGAGSEVYDPTKPPKSVSLWDVSNPERPNLLAAVPSAHRDGVAGMRFSRDGRTLWSVDQNVTTVRWDTSQSLRKDAEGLAGRVDSQRQVAIRPDGRLIASGPSISSNGGVLRDISDLGKVRLLEGGLPDYDGGPMEFGPDGKVLATGGGQVLLWDVSTSWRPRRYGSPFGGEADELAISPDGLMLAVGKHDGTVTLWSIADPSAPFQLGDPLTEHAHPIASLAWTPDGRGLATGDTTGTITLWDTSAAVDTMADRVALACARAGRDLTDAEWDRYVGPGPTRQKPCA